MSETTTVPIPKPRPKPVYAMIQIGNRRKFKARILWDEYDDRRPDTFVVLGPKDMKFTVHRPQMTMLP